MVLLAALAALALTVPQPLAAYVGPGSGLTVIGAALAFVGGLFLAVVGFVWYPIKRLRARFKRSASEG
jgi:hypothetical protein